MVTTLSSDSTTKTEVTQNYQQSASLQNSPAKILLKFKRKDISRPAKFSKCSHQISKRRSSFSANALFCSPNNVNNGSVMYMQYVYWYSTKLAVIILQFGKRT
ncbi:DNA mismatch repair protein [Dirofilaria immitis]